LSGPQKKADAAERLEAFDHAGLLTDEPPDNAEPPFIQSSDDFDRLKFSLERAAGTRGLR